MGTNGVRRNGFQGRVALVTGASSGIGRATAEALAAAGAAVALAARRGAVLEEVALDIRARGAEALAIPLDVSDRAALRRCVDAVAARFGRLDLLVNNAGIGRRAAFGETTEADVEALVRTNLLAPIYLTQAALPLLAAVCGTVVLVSSVAGRRGFPNAAVYCATKFGLAGLAESLRVELAPLGVRTILVCPGRTDTEFFVKAGFPAEHGPGGRATMARPAAVASAILGMVANGRRERVLSRGGRLIIGLNKVAPALCDRLVARLPP